MKTLLHLQKRMMLAIAFFAGMVTMQSSMAQCLTCPSSDFDITPSVAWQLSSSDVQTSGCKIYKVAVTSGTNYTFKTGCADGATANFDTYLELYSNDCSYIMGNDDNCEGGRSRLVWEATYSGLVYLKVRGWSSTSGTYTLAYQGCVINASFAYSSSGADVLFTDLSTNATSWAWDFGDGGTSTQQNPSHTYACPGGYYVTLTVTNSDGCSAETYEYIDAEGNFTADFTFVVNGTSVAFTNTSVGSGLNYYWEFGDGNTSTLQNPSHTYDCPDDMTVDLTVTDGNGCQLSTYDFVEVPGDLSASFTYTKNNTTINLTNTSTGSGLSYYWEFGDGSTSTLQNPSHTYDCPGGYYVKLSITDGNGCQQSDYIYLVVESSLNSAFTYTANGSVVSFTNTSFGAGLTYYWDFDDGATSSQANPTHTYECQGTYYVHLGIIDGNGCFDYAYNYVTIEGDLGADFSTSASGNTVSFSDQSVGSPTSWYWDFGDGGSSSQQNPTHVYGCPGDYNVSLSIQNSEGCIDYSYEAINVGGFSTGFSYEVDGNTVIFTNNSTGGVSSEWDFGDGSTSISTNPTHTFDCGGYYVALTVDNGGGCQGDHYEYILLSGGVEVTVEYTLSNSTVSFNSTATGSNLTYYWDFGDGETSVLADPTHTYNGCGSYYGYVSAEDDQGCYAYEEFVIYIEGTTSVSVSGSSSVCYGGDIVLSGNTSGVGNFYWIGPGNYYEENVQNPTISNANNDNAGTYTLVVLDGNGCPNTGTVDVSIYQNDLTVTQTGSALTSNQDGATYQWINCSNGTPVSGATSQSFSPTVNGTYKVMLSGNGCAAEYSECVTVNNVGIDVAEAVNIELYPNPNNGRFTMNMPMGNYSLEVFSAVGQLVYVSSLQGSSNHVIDLGNVTKGVYTLRLSNAEQTRSQRIIIQ